jgi:ribosomal protein S14
MLFFKYQKSILQQKINFFKEVYYKLCKLLVIFLKSQKLLARLIVQRGQHLYYRNICIFSKKAKSVSRKLKASRIMIRELSNKKLFFGLHKVS